LAEHPFVQRSKDEKTVQKSPEIIIARKLGKKQKKREREATDSEQGNDDTIPGSPNVKPINMKPKNKRHKGLKAKVEATTKTPVEQFNPYKIDEPSKSKSLKPAQTSSGKSLTFKG
jgi:hypothetical protein